MLRFGYLETNSHLVGCVVTHLLHVLFDSKCRQYIFVVLSLVILAELVAHNNSAQSCISLASFEVSVVQRRSLHVENPIVKFGILQNLIKVIIWWFTPHDDNISFCRPMICVEALFQEVVDGIWLPVTE